jgi:tRNA G10  N-methylase Trm11
MEFLLFAGTDHPLSAVEISTSLSQATMLKNGLYSFESLSPKKAIEKVQILGSAIKLLVKTSPWSENPISIPEIEKSKNFSVSFIPLDLEKSRNTCESLKNNLSGNHRFILSKAAFGLTPLIITKEKVNEVIVFENHLWQTIWVQDFRSWIKKDRHLPYANAKAGLLPPKIARTLINLSGIKPTKTKTLLDPFCGSGRILVEALELGFQIIGSDISKGQIEQTKANLEFLQFDQNLYQLFQSDASKIKNFIPINSIDLIITEPFLGRPNPRLDQIPDLVKGLEKLYLGALKSWLPILKNKALIVMIFPQIATPKKTFLTSRIIDDPHLIGYNVKTKNLTYSRPEATIRREIIILQKK